MKIASLDAEIGYVTEPDEIREVLEGVVADSVAATREALAGRGSPIAEKIPVLRRPFPRVTFATAEAWLGRPGAGRDFSTEEEKAIGERVERELGAPFYFLTDYPTSVKAQTFYAWRRDDDPSLTGYFDLDYRGLEIASGGRREHRVDRLRANLRSAGLDASRFASYLEAFRFGMPPHGGWGLGIDRLVQGLAGLPNIRESRLFPRDRYRLEP